MRPIRASLLLAIVVVFVSPLRADDKSKALDEQYVALAGARATAELAIRRAGEACDENKTPWHAVIEDLNEAHSALMDSYEKAKQVEQRKPDEDRNQQLIDDLNEKQSAADRDWNAYVNKDRAATDARYREAGETVGALREAMEGLNTTEHAWKNAAMDLAPLKAAYEALTQKANAVTASTTQMVADLQTQLKKWQTLVSDRNAPSKM